MKIARKIEGRKSFWDPSGFSIRIEGPGLDGLNKLISTGTHYCTLCMGHLFDTCTSMVEGICRALPNAYKDSVGIAGWDCSLSKHTLR